MGNAHFRVRTLDISLLRGSAALWVKLVGQDVTIFQQTAATEEITGAWNFSFAPKFIQNVPPLPATTALAHVGQFVVMYL